MGEERGKEEGKDVGEKRGRMRGRRGRRWGVRGEEGEEEGEDEKKNVGRKRRRKKWVQIKEGDSSPHPVGPRRRMLLLPSCGPSFFSVEVWGVCEAWSMLWGSSWIPCASIPFA